MTRSQAFRARFKGDGACALGAALLAVGVSPEEARCSRLVCQVIVHLNDDHRWTREKIEAWVAGIEPFQPPDDPTGATLSTLSAASMIRGHGDQTLCEELAA